MPPNTFLNLSKAREDLPLNIILYDVLNTPIDDQLFAHKEIVKFLKNKPAGSRFAIFVLSNKLHLLQGFTEDENQLVSAINGKVGRPSMQPATPGSPDAATAAELLSDSGVLPNNPAALGIVDRLQHLESIQANYFLARRVEQTIGAFSEIARFVSGLPGRKNLIWLSGSFPAGVLPGGDPIDPYGANASYTSDLKEAADRLTLSQVAVYPVDIRGLNLDPAFSASNSRVYRSPGSFNQAIAKFGQQLAAEHTTMDEIAEDSGGHAFYNTNGLEQAVAASVEDGMNYYTLSYSPSNKNFDGGLRKIRVALGQKGYHLSYRRSYFADDASVLAGKKAKPASERVEAAMLRGAPPAQELIFEVHISTEGAPARATQEQIDQLSHFSGYASQQKWDTVQIQRYSIDYAVLGRQLALPESADGRHRGALEFVFAAYDADGNTLFGRHTEVEENFPPHRFEEVRSAAYLVRQQIDVPTGAAWLRVGVQDTLGSRIGSLEFPLPLTPEHPTVSEAAPHR